MQIYILIILLIIFIGLSVDKSNNKIANRISMSIIFFLLFVIAGFRGESIGNDTSLYINLFNQISREGFQGVLSYSNRFENGYLFLNWLISIFTKESQFLLIISSFFCLLVIIQFINKYSSIRWLSIFLFITMGYFSSSMNVIRSFWALFFIILAFNYLKANRFYRFILLCIIASTFHKTAIIFLIVWPLKNLKLTKKKIFYLLLINIIMFLFFNDFLIIVLKIFPQYQYYVGSIYLNNQIRLASVMNFLVSFVILIFGYIVAKSKNKKIDRHYLVCIQNQDKFCNSQLFLKLLILGTSIEFISFKFNLLNRVSDYFLIFSIVYLPNIIAEINNSKLKVLIIYITVILFFIYFSVIQIYRPEWNHIYPYRFFWQ